MSNATDYGDDISGNTTPQRSMITSCELKTMQGFADGLRAPEIAARYGWSLNLPHVYAHRVKRKLRARTRMQALVICVRRGFLRA